MQKSWLLIFIFTLITPMSCLAIGLGDQGFYTPEGFCKLRSNNRIPTKINPPAETGEGECLGEMFHCVEPDVAKSKCAQPNAYCSPDVSSQAGTQLKELKDYTGTTLFCNENGKPDGAMCGFSYQIDKGASKPGDVCPNKKPVGMEDEVDNKCFTAQSRSGEKTYERIFNDLAQDTVTNIDEDSFATWTGNDPWDASGGEEQLKAFISSQQESFMYGLFVPATYGEVTRTKDNYFDKGQPVMGGLNLADKGGHAVIFLRVNISQSAGDLLGSNRYAYKFEIVDPTFPGDASFLECRDSVSLITRKTIISCSSKNYPDQSISLGTFNTRFTDKLIESKNSACPRSGDLCSQTATARAFQFASYLGNFKNWGIPKSPFGVCAGWSAGVMKLAYLANFIGEKKADAEQPVCASWVGGEEKTARCENNKSGCVITWISQDSLAVNGGATVGSQFTLCAHKNPSQATPLPNHNLLNEGFGLKTIQGCDGAQKSVPFSISTPFDVNYVAEPLDSSGQTTASILKLPTTVGDLTKFRKQIGSVYQSTRKSLLALVAGTAKPSCATEVSNNGTNFSFTYQNGYIFSQPAKKTTSGQASNPTPLLQNLSRLWGNDAVFVPGSDTAWVWLNGPSDAPVPVSMDPFSGGFISTLHKQQIADGVEKSCEQSDLPTHFQAFLTSSSMELNAFSSPIPVPPSSAYIPATSEKKVTSSSPTNIFYSLLNWLIVLLIIAILLWIGYLSINEKKEATMEDKNQPSDPSTNLL